MGEHNTDELLVFTHSLAPRELEHLYNLNFPSVGFFHFLYAWNDFYEPLIFLHSRENWTLAVGLQTFDAIYTINTHLIMTVSVLMIISPILLFFFLQRIFRQGVVFSRIKIKVESCEPWFKNVLKINSIAEFT